MTKTPCVFLSLNQYTNVGIGDSRVQRFLMNLLRESNSSDLLELKTWGRSKNYSGTRKLIDCKTKQNIHYTILHTYLGHGTGTATSATLSAAVSASGLAASVISAVSSASLL